MTVIQDSLLCNQLKKIPVVSMLVLLLYFFTLDFLCWILWQVHRPLLATQNLLPILEILFSKWTEET